mgnify:CR=1 FL=1
MPKTSKHCSNFFLHSWVILESEDVTYNANLSECMCHQQIKVGKNLQYPCLSQHPKRGIHLQYHHSRGNWLRGFGGNDEYPRAFEEIKKNISVIESDSISNHVYAIHHDWLSILYIYTHACMCRELSFQIMEVNYSFFVAIVSLFL